MTPDINILVAAFRIDHIHHRPAIAWLNDAIADCELGGSIEILPMIVAGFLRLVTNNRIFPDPAPIKNAVAFIDVLLTVPGVDLSAPAHEWPLLRNFCSDGKLSGNAITDAWIAASVKSIHGHLVTFDRGFARLLNKGELTVLSVTR